MKHGRSLGSFAVCEKAETVIVQLVNSVYKIMTGT
jgi:hypothetical protein